MDFEPSQLSSDAADHSNNVEGFSNDAVSPNIMPTDLTLDTSDSLNLLLHNSAQGLDSSMEMAKSGSVADWSQLTTLWPPFHDHHYMGDPVKYPDISMDYNLSLQMAMDYNPSMAVDPSTLHFESTYHTPSLFTTSLPLSTEFLSSSYPFTFGSDESSSSSSNSDRRRRRLSITSSSSSSGASFSPVIESKIPFVAKVENPADELAQRVRQSAGVLLAVPMGVHGQPAQRPPQTQSKLPIPRLPRPKVTTKVKRLPPPRSEASSAASSPPASDVHTSSPDLTSPSEPSTAIPSPIVPPTTGRPKTSHTTIERRYRTNLNARIQSLRQAVPALRVLEDKGRPRKDGEPIDVVDERGFVDGVKVARKCSKANVLGKAVEYIRVLKRREHRLIREQNGLKSLISGLVGGPALLKEWETEWRANFGGEETDEVEVEPVSEDDEGDDEDGDEASKEEDEGRAKKKVKVAKTIKKPTKKIVPLLPATVPAVLTTPNLEFSPSNVTPEKRKRGRPRKIPASSPSSGAEVVYTTNVLSSEMVASAVIPEQPNAQESATSIQGQASQYLLATFALFSFFNSPLTQASPRSSPHAHTGVVLGHIHAQQPLTTVRDGFTWRDLIQAFHLLVSALVFCSILVPWLPTAIRSNKLMSYLLSPISWLFVTDAAKSERSPSPAIRLESKEANASLFDRLPEALDSSRRGVSNEAEQLRSALDVSTGFMGFVHGTIWKRTGKDHGFEHKGLVQRAWVRLGELAVLDSTTSVLCRMHTYWCMRSYVPWFSASPSDLSTLALLVWRISRSKATSLWSRAQNTQLLRAHERLVLEFLTVDEAATRLASRSRTNMEREKYNPIGVLADIVIRERIKRHAATLFIRTVEDQLCDGHDSDGDEANRIEEEERTTIKAAKSLGGRTGELGEILESVWKTDICSVDEIERVFEIHDGEGKEVDIDETEDGIKSLLEAVILYRRIFPTSLVSRSNGNGNGVCCILLSPPPSPSRKNSKMHLALRRILGSGVFDYSDFTGRKDVADNESGHLGIALDDARDRVVDMLMDLEQQLRGCGKKGDAVSF